MRLLARFYSDNPIRVLPVEQTNSKFGKLTSKQFDAIKLPS
jgi:hypothetical protein